MTNARLTNPAKGHGLTQRILDPIFADLAVGKPVEQIACLVILQPVGYGEEKGKKHVRFEPIRLELATDEQHTRQQIADSYALRTSPKTIPMAFPGWKDEDQRQFLIGCIREWAEEQGMSAQDLREVIVDYFGGDGFAPADVDKLSAVQAKEFAGFKGVIAEDADEAIQEPDDVEPSDEDAEP